MPNLQNHTFDGARVDAVIIVLIDEIEDEHGKRHGHQESHDEKDDAGNLTFC
jgi:hypothetical protein